MDKKRKTSYKMGMLISVALILGLNILFLNTALSSWYTFHLYPYLADALACVTGLIPFAIGEICMYLGAILLILAVIFSLLWIFLRKKTGYTRLVKRYLKTCSVMGIVVLFLYTFCWSIPFHQTLLGLEARSMHELEELRSFREEIVLQLNELSQQVDREADGRIRYPEDVDAKVEHAMQELGAEFPILKGYYPPIKVAMCTDFLEWMGIGGYTYPFTMEVTCNGYLSRLYYPTLLSHEMAHHKGFYKESEANLISFLACSQSEDPLLRYSAYDDMYYYINGEYLGQLAQAYSLDEIKQIMKSEVKLVEQIHVDEQQAQEEARKLYESQVNEDMEVFSEYADKVADVGWEAQEKILKEANYDGVVGLVLEYRKQHNRNEEKEK